jgi:hypothetical protein
MPLNFLRRSKRTFSKIAIGNGLFSQLELPLFPPTISSKRIDPFVRLHD